MCQVVGKALFPPLALGELGGKFISPTTKSGEIRTQGRKHLCLKANIQRECETAAVNLIAIAKQNGGVFLTTRLHKYYSPSAERIASVRVHVKQHVKHTHKHTHTHTLGFTSRRQKDSYILPCLRPVRERERDFIARRYTIGVNI